MILQVVAITLKSHIQTPSKRKLRNELVSVTFVASNLIIWESS